MQHPTHFVIHTPILSYSMPLKPVWFSALKMLLDWRTEADMDNKLFYKGQGGSWDVASLNFMCWVGVILIFNRKEYQHLVHIYLSQSQQKWNCWSKIAWLHTRIKILSFINHLQWTMYCGQGHSGSISGNSGHPEWEASPLQGPSCYQSLQFHFSLKVKFKLNLKVFY